MRLPTFDLTEWRSILLALLATRVGLLATGLVGAGVMPRGESYVDLVAGLPWLSMWVQGDAEYYADIAVAGYSYDANATSTTASFRCTRGSSVLARRCSGA